MTDQKTQTPDWSAPLWPGLLAAQAGVALTRSWLDALAPSPRPSAPAAEKSWASDNQVVLSLSAARLRRFGAETGHKRTPTLVCAPFALHDARIADLCPDHSLMTALAGAGPLYLVEWLSATAAQAFRTIDDYLSDLNIFVDEIGGRCDLVGLCQGGWLALAFAARFPKKARKLAIAAAPIDLEAGATAFSTLARLTPLETFRELVRLGAGLARGAQAQIFWGMIAKGDAEIHALLRDMLPVDSQIFRQRADLFRAWSAAPLDLPGAYYLEVVERLYKNNELARGTFVALGKTIDLKAVKAPLYLISADHDEVASTAQVFACADLVATQRDEILRATAPCGHLDLFVGAPQLQQLWPNVAHWLAA